MGDAAYHVFDLVDLGDFVGVDGPRLPHPQGRAERQARELELLSKALRPLPEKWHGLTDVEMRYRQRYLDLSRTPRCAASS